MLERRRNEVCVEFGSDANAGCSGALARSKRPQISWAAMPAQPIFLPLLWPILANYSLSVLYWAAAMASKEGFYLGLTQGVAVNPDIVDSSGKELLQ